MNETYVTIQGRLVADPVSKTTQNDQPFCVFRIATSSRRPKPGHPGEWEDSATSFYHVTAWRALGLNAAASLHRGQPVTVYGRQRINYFTRADGSTGASAEIDARSIGHDLTWGTTVFTKGTRQAEDPGERMNDSNVQAAIAELAGEDRRFEAGDEGGFEGDRSGLGDPRTDDYVIEDEPAVRPQGESAA